MLNGILKFSWTAQIYRRIFYKGMDPAELKEAQQKEIAKLTNYGINEVEAEMRMTTLVKEMNV